MKIAIRKTSFIFLLIFLINTVSAQESALADPRSVVVSNDVRFTVLTDGVVRMEWDSLSRFNDNASFVFINRKLPVPQFTQQQKGGWLTITTEKIVLKYKVNSGKLSSKNLQIKYLDKTDAFAWNPDVQQSDNLKGTARTLDAFDGNTHREDSTKVLEIEDGLLSRDGWTLIDDSQSLLFDNSEWPWVEERPHTSQQDWYFFAYGKNYKSALSDYSKIAGKVPLPPRYAFGYWWSRYWSYSDNEIRDLVGNFEKYDIPLDVLVLDMNWHYTDSLNAPKDEFGEKQHWTGWTWNERLFPNPDKFLSWTNNRNLQTTLNLHPASGIAPYEAQYKEFAKRMNFDTSTGKNIPYEGSDKKFIKNLFDVVLRPMEKDGIDFWWLDWQQWINDKKIPTLNNTWWLNYTFFSDMERNSDKRPMLYHRWGGLGNHRYQIGFSGDAIISWKSLAFQPYFTNCASNVLYGYWSHDIGGHMFKVGTRYYLEPELFTRWMQYGALSPIFRTHSTKHNVLNKELWNFRGEYFDALLDAIKLRYQLVPYIYTMARKTYDEGLSLCRPMYYDYPMDKKAYKYQSQYMFGDDVLVAPIGEPMKNGLSSVKVWLPEGNDWFEWHTGTVLAGGQEILREFSIEEYPVYIKSGAILPMYIDAKNLSDEQDQMMIGVFLNSNTQFDIYEDAGNSKDYDKAFSKTQVSSAYNDRKQTVTIHPRRGEYGGMASDKQYTVKLYGVEMPDKVIVNGSEIRYSPDREESKWNYVGSDLSVNINLPATACNKEQVIEVLFDQNRKVDVNQGYVKQFRELTKIIKAMKYKRSSWEITDSIGACEATNLKLQYEPENFYQHLDYFKENYSKSFEEITKLLNAKP